MRNPTAHHSSLLPAGKSKLIPKLYISEEIAFSEEIVLFGCTKLGFVTFLTGFVVC